MVFQNYALYPHMTVFDNMAFSLTLAKAPKSVTEQEVGRAAKILGLDPLLQRYPRQLSGGQRQRVAMGRAIVRNPQVFLFDEPLSNLDAKLRVQMRAEIKELHQRLKVTTVYVTHDQIEAMTMADKIVVMNGGNIEQIGRPLDLYDRPANLFVAGFIGSPAMNMVKGTITGGALRMEDGTALAAADQRFRRQGRPGRLRRAARAPDARWRRHSGHRAGGRADRFGNPGPHAHRRPVGDRRLSRARVSQARRDPAGAARYGARPSVRPAIRSAALVKEKVELEEDSKMAFIIRRREALALGASAAALALARTASGQTIPKADVAPPKLPIESGAHAAPDQARALRRTRRGDLPRQLCEVRQGDRRRGQGRPRGLGGHHPADRRLRQYRRPVPTSSSAGRKARTSMPIKCSSSPTSPNISARSTGGWMFLGEKYGKKAKTNNWIGIPMGGSGGPLIYRTSAIKEAGHDKIPGDLPGFLKLLPGFSRRSTSRRASRSATRWATPTASPTGCYGRNGGSLVDEDGKVAINSKETLAALNYVKELYPSFVPGTMSWERHQQQPRLCVERAVPDVQRRVALLLAQERPGDQGDRRRHRARGAHKGRCRVGADVGARS